jgi:hypothetical protein
LWAGTKKLSLGNPPAQSSINLNSSANCVDGVLRATNKNNMLVALANWSACSGRPIILGNLLKMEDADIGGIKSNSSSDDALYVYLSQLSNPITQASTSVIEKMKAALTKPEIQCNLPPDQYGYHDIGVGTLDLKVTNLDCNYENLTVKFAEEQCSVSPKAGVITADKYGTNNKFVTFEIYVDPTKFPQLNSGCNYTVLQSGKPKLSAYFFANAGCSVAYEGQCGELLEQDTARNVLGCSDDALKNAVSSMFNLTQDEATGRYDKQLFINRVRFRDGNIWNLEGIGGDPPSYEAFGEVCKWSTPQW